MAVVIIATTWLVGDGNPLLNKAEELTQSINLYNDDDDDFNFNSNSETHPELGR
jgi:hypothetical protein